MVWGTFLFVSKRANNCLREARIVCALFSSILQSQNADGGNRVRKSAPRCLLDRGALGVKCYLDNAHLNRPLFKQGLPKQNYSFQVCDGDWGDLLCGRGKLCSSSWPIVFTRPESDRSLALSFTADALEIWLIWLWWRCPLESCLGTNFSTAFSQISDRLEIWNHLITACSQLVNSILYLFRQLMTKHPTFRIRSACGNVFGKSLA